MPISKPLLLQASVDDLPGLAAEYERRWSKKCVPKRARSEFDLSPACTFWEYENDLLREAREWRRKGLLSYRDLRRVVWWKSWRPLWLIEQNTPDSVVRVTRAALSAERTWLATLQLRELRGVGLPTASAVLHVVDPDRVPLIDINVLAALGWRCKSVPESKGCWEAYSAEWEKIRDQTSMDGRTLDRALWQLGADILSRGGRSC